MKIGIIQGRLSEPKEGFQECPTEWEREFDLLSELDLNHIEWIVTYENFHRNPIFHRDLKGYPISSVCADFMVSDKFCDLEYLNKFLRPLCRAVQNNNIKDITIPLLENSSVNKKDVREKFIDIFYPYTEEYKNINFLIEAELHQKKLKEILGINTNLFVTYDTGNITSYGLNHEEYIEKVFFKIRNVHLKDRTTDPISTVEPGRGDTNFKLILDILNKKGYDFPYTIQTARGKTGEEINTIRKHKLYYEKLI